jgi:hypothetical protein
MEKTSDLTFLIKKLIFFYFFNEKTSDLTFLTKKLMFYSVWSDPNPSNSVQVKFIIQNWTELDHTFQSELKHQPGLDQPEFSVQIAGLELT